MGVPLFLREIRNPLRVIGAWGSGAGGFVSMSFDVRLDIIQKYGIKQQLSRMFTLNTLVMTPCNFDNFLELSDSRRLARTLHNI